MTHHVGLTTRQSRRVTNKLETSRNIETTVYSNIYCMIPLLEYSDLVGLLTSPPQYLHIPPAVKFIVELQ